MYHGTVDIDKPIETTVVHGCAFDVERYEHLRVYRSKFIHVRPKCAIAFAVGKEVPNERKTMPPKILTRKYVPAGH